MINKVIIMGRLGRDPEIRYMSCGTPVANFSVATDEKQKGGQKKTTWHNVVAWSKTAEICEQYLKKGSLVFIEGKIQHREWEDRDGNKRTSVEIVAQEVRMIGGDAGADRREGPSENRKEPATTAETDPVKIRVWKKMQQKRLGEDESADLWRWVVVKSRVAPADFDKKFDYWYKAWETARTTDPAPDDDDIPF